jgi:hypothetical protein
MIAHSCGVRHARELALLLVLPLPAFALSSDAKEFMRIVAELEPVQCEKRKLRREIALAEAQGQDARALKNRFDALSREPKTAKLEKRLGQLEPRVSKSSDPEDLAAISRQQREAYYRCEQ